MAINNKFSIFNFQFSVTSTSFFLLLILIIAIFFRLWRLDSIPPGLYPDVAIYANDGFETLKTGDFKVFYPENNGREGLYMLLLAASFWIFGASVWSIKIVTAIIGILTVLGVYLLARELFKESRSSYVPLLSSFFIAISFWHTNFSRIGFRAILVPFVLVFAFYFLFRGLARRAKGEMEDENFVLIARRRLSKGGTKQFLNFIVAGIFFGLGAYTYISYRFVVFLLPIVLFCWYLTYRKENQSKDFIKFSAICLLFAFVVALPIFVYFLQNPQDFFGRANGVSILSTKEPIKEFGKSLILHLGMFNFSGDQNWRHNFAGSPTLPHPIGFLFLVGIIFSASDVIRSWRNGDRLKFQAHCLVLGWFFVLLGPGFLSFEGAPHALRVIGTIPAVYILSGLGGFRLYDILNKKIKSAAGKKSLITVSFLFLVFSFYGEFNKYFFLWAKNPNVEGAFTKQFSDIGYYLNSLPEDTKKYVIVNESGVAVPYPNGIPMPAQTIMFIENTKYGKPRAAYLLPKNLSQIKIESEAVIIPMSPDEGLFEKLSQMFPSGEKKEEQGVWMYEIK